MELKAPHKKSYYKNDDSWYKAIYRANKAIIDEATAGINEKTARWRIIKDDIESRSKYEKISKVKALKALSHTEKYTSPAERMINNVRKGLSSLDPRAMKQFQNLLKDKKGRYSKIDYSNMQYIGNNTYIYKNPNGKDIVVSFENSPKTVKVTTYEEYINTNK